MNRRKFIKTSGFATASLCFFSYEMFACSYKEITDEALTGKKKMIFKDESIKLQDEALESFLLMKKAALMEGIDITAVSAYRSYADQKRIWNRKYKSFTESGLSPMESIKKIVEYSTMPGTSRHHWATDVDIIDGSVAAPTNVLSTSHFLDGGVYSKLKRWMDRNSRDYGFYLVYTDDESRKGFKYEPWHFSFRPISCEYLRLYRERNIYKILVKSDLASAEHISKDFLEQYYHENILDINPELL